LFGIVIRSVIRREPRGRSRSFRRAGCWTARFAGEAAQPGFVVETIRTRTVPTTRRRCERLCKVRTSFRVAPGYRPVTRVLVIRTRGEPTLRADACCQ